MHPGAIRRPHPHLIYFGNRTDATAPTGAELASEAEELEKLGGRVDLERELFEIVIVRPYRDIKFECERGQMYVVGVTVFKVLPGEFQMRRVVGFVVTFDRQRLDGRVQLFEPDLVPPGKLWKVLHDLRDRDLRGHDEQIGSVLKDTPCSSSRNRREQDVAIRGDAS